MKKTKPTAKKKAGPKPNSERPFHLVSSVESQIAGDGGCITWQGYRAMRSNKEPEHWPDFYVATLMRNKQGRNLSEYDLLTIGGQSPYHAIKYTVLSHGIDATFVVKGVTTVVKAGATHEVPKYEDGDEKHLPVIRFAGDVLFLRAEPVVALKKDHGEPTSPPKIPPPPYPGDGKERQA